MKSTITITVDTELALAIKGRGVNLSGLINNFLKDYILLPEPNGDEKHEKILEALKKLIEQRAEESKKKKVIIRG